MTSVIHRRVLLGTAAAAGVLPHLPAWGATCADGELVFAGEIIASPSMDISGCAALGAEIAELDAEITRLQTAPDTTIEAMYVALESDLAEKASKRRAAADAVRGAIKANNAKIKSESIKAIRKTNDLVLATAMQTRNPNLIGAAAGVHVLTGTGVFAYQAIEAKNGKEVQKAAITLFQDRKAMVSIMTSKPGRKLAEKQVKLVLKIGRSAWHIGQATINNVALRDDLGELEAELDGLRSDIAGLPVNLPETRAYFVNRTVAMRELYEILASACSGNDCKIDSGPIPIGGLF